MKLMDFLNFDNGMLLEVAGFPLSRCEETDPFVTQLTIEVEAHVASLLIDVNQPAPNLVSNEKLMSLAQYFDTHFSDISIVARGVAWHLLAAELCKYAQRLYDQKCKEHYLKTNGLTELSGLLRNPGSNGIDPKLN